MADDLLDELSTAERANALWKDARQFTAEWRTNAREDYGFVDGSGQWDETDKQKLRDELRPAITFNRVGPVVDAVCGSEINNRQEVRYIPREQGDVQINEILSSAAEWVRDQCDAEDEDSDAFRDTVTCGMGWTETRMDYEIDPEGRICIDRVDPLEMYWDTSAKKRNLSDARWMLRVKEFSKEELTDKFGKDVVDNISGPDSLWGDDLDEDSPHVVEAGDQYDGAGESDAKKTGYKVIEFQWFDAEPIVRVSDPEGGKVLELSPAEFKTLEDRHNMISDQMLETTGEILPQLKSVKAKKRVYKRAFIIGNDVIDEGESPCNHSFTFKAITGYRDRNTNTWYGLVRAMKDPQRWANKWLSQTMHIINSNAKGGLMAEKTAFDNVRDAETTWASPNSITWMREGALSQGKVQPKPPITFPAGMDRLMEFAVTSIRDVTGVNQELMGLADRQQAGVLEYQRRQSGLNILGTLFDALRRYRKEQGRLLMYFIQEYISDGRLVKVLGKESEQYIPLVKNEEIGQYDVIVDDAPTSPNQKEKVFGMLSSLLPSLMKMGIPLPPELLDYSPLPTSLAQKWKEQITQGQAQIPPEIQQQIEQGKQMIGELQAENQTLKSGQQEKMMKTQSDAEAKRQEFEAKSQLDELEFAHRQRMADAEIDLKERIAQADLNLDAAKAQAQYDLKANEIVSKELETASQIDE